MARTIEVKMEASKPKKELRQFPRYPVNLPAEAETYQRRLPVVLTDMSVSGLGIQAAKELTPGIYISVHITLGRKFIFHGQVMWAFDTLTPKGRIYMAGIETDVIIDRRAELINVAQRESVLEEIVMHLKSRKREGDQ